MNLWENIAKGASEFGKMASNPKTYRTLEHLVNTGGEALQGGFNTIQQNPYIGPYVTGAGVAAQQAMNSPQLKPALGAAAGAYGALKSLNPVVGLAASQIPKLLPDNTPTQEQLVKQKENLQESRTAFDLSNAKYEGRKGLAKQGDIHDWKETTLNQAVYLPKFGGELISGVGEFVSGGLGNDWDKSWEEKGYENLYENFERENKNKIFFGNIPFVPGDAQKPDYGKKKLAEMPEAIVSRLPDKVFKDIYEGNVNSQYDLDREFKKATQIYETESIVQPLLMQKVESGEITAEEAQKAFQEHLNEQGLREFATLALTDPLMYVNPFSKVGKIGKGVIKAGEKVQKFGKRLSKSKDVLTGKKVPSVIDESEKAVAEIDNIIKEAETPQIKEAGKVSEEISSKVKLTESQFNTQKRKILDNPEIQFEDKQQLLKQLANKTEFKPAKPEVKNVASKAAKERVNEIQQTHPGLDNKDASEVMLQESKKAIRKEADEIANEAWTKMKQYGGPDVVDGPLVATYTPPKVSLTAKNTMVANPAMNPQPIEIQFRNPIQKLFYELSLPYNRAIVEGYGMDFNQHKQIMSNMTKNFAEPLTKILTGGFDPAQIQKTKRVMGAVGSELAKSSVNHVPGTPLVFDNLKVADMLDDLLLNANKVPAIKKSTLGSITEIPNIKAPAASAEAAGREIQQQYKNIVDYFTSIGIPEKTAKKAAVFYNRTLEKSGLSGAGGLIEGAEDGLTAGKAYNVDILNDLDGMHRSMAIELHEDFHQVFDYLRATSDNPGTVQAIIKSNLTKDIPDQGMKYFNDIKKALKIINTEASVITDEMMSYFVQTKKEMKNGLFSDNPVSKTFMSLMRRANNGDESARRLLDNFEGVEQALRKHGDEFEKGLVQELQGITLPDGNNAWTTINKVDPANMKGFYPGEKYGAKTASVGDYQNYLKDSTERMNRLQDLMGSQEVVYRGTTKAPSTGKPRTNPMSNDQMYGPGTYTSTNPQQAFGYTGLGKMPDQVAKSFQGSGTGDMRAYYQGLERPLFWDEQVPMDLFETVIESKNKIIQKAVEIIGGEEQIAIMSIEEFVKDMPEAIQMVLNPKLQKAWKYDDLVASQTKHGEEVFNLLMDEVYKKSGYDGFVGPATDDALGLVQGGGFEVVPFEGHNLLERTKEMRELGKKSSKTKNFTLTPNRAYGDDGPVDLADLTDQINNIQNRTAKGVSYHINQIGGLE